MCCFAKFIMYDKIVLMCLLLKLNWHYKHKHSSEAGRYSLSHVYILWDTHMFNSQQRILMTLYHQVEDEVGYFYHVVLDHLR